VRPEHIDRRRPEFWMATGERQRHVPAIRPAHHADPAGVDAWVTAQVFDAGDVVKSILAAPVAVDARHVVLAVAGRAANVRYEYGEPAQRQVLNERHREPREVRPLLALWTAMDVVHDRTRPDESQLFRRQVETRRDAESIVARERRILAGPEHR